MTPENSYERMVGALHRIVQTIQTAGELPELLQSIMAESQRLLNCEASALFLYDEERGDLYFEIIVGGDEEVRAIRVPITQGIVGAAATEGKTQIVNDWEADERRFKITVAGGLVTRNLIATPMMRNGRLIGVLEVLNKTTGEFDEMDGKIIEIMAEQAAIQIENARLIRARLQAERLAALGTTAAGLAHYIKNVLAQWNGSASLIEMGLDKDSAQLIADAWPIMKRSHAKISKLVKDMLTISRERELEIQELDLNEMAYEVIEESRARAKTGEVKLKVELDPSLPPMALDPNRLHDVLLNLVCNAVEAIEETRMEDCSVTLRTIYDPEEKLLRIEVEDDGPGMPPQVQARVFEPFFSTKGSRGTGLGLAVASKHIEEHGGRMSLHSELSVGTKFTVQLPVKAFNQDAEAPTISFNLPTKERAE